MSKSNKACARTSRKQEKLEYENDLKLANRMQEQSVIYLMLSEEIPDIHQLFLYFNQKYFF